MSAKKRRKSKARGSNKPKADLRGEIRQILRFPELRIEIPERMPVDAGADLQAPAPEPQPEAQPERTDAVVAAEVVTDRLICEAANCMWYLKTRFFRREWHSQDTDDEDPRVRRALSRLNRGIDALTRTGAEVVDPTGKRYPPGAEGLMRPIQHQPTPGLTVEMVTETVTPIVFRNERLIQSGEVFVAVPLEGPPTESPDATPAGGQPRPNSIADGERH